MILSIEHVLIFLTMQKINQKYHNGPLLEYKVFVDDAEVEARGPQEVSSSLPIPCEGQHNVSVRGCNQQGCSPKASILIPSYRGKTKKNNRSLLLYR